MPESKTGNILRTQWHLLRALAVSCCFTLLLGACGTLGTRAPEAGAGQAREAAALAARGQFDAAAQAYLQLAGGNRSLRDHYRLLAAEAWRQGGELARAGATIDQTDRRNLHGDEPLRLDLLRAERALDAHDAATALKLTAVPDASVPAELRPRLLELRARALDASGDIWGSARTRVGMQDLLHGFDRTQNQQEIVAQLARLGAGPLQQRAQAMQPGDRMLPWVNAALTQLGVTVARAQPELGRPVGTLLPDKNATVREGYKVPQRIALLLPMDGAYASAGASVAEGFFAAYFDAGRDHAPRPSVRVYSTHGTAPGTLAAYRQALADRAQLVVGPLTRGDVSAVFGQGRLALPILALNQPDDRQLPGSDASEFGLIPETEGAQAAGQLIERGLRHAYAIASGDDYAQRALAAFKAEMFARGGELVASTTFSSTGTQLATLKLADAPADAAIFISMRPEEARVLVPQLRAAGIQLPIVATSHVYAGTDDAGANRDLDGVEFSDAPWLFDAEPGLPRRADIDALLPAARGASARLFAFGMDAWRLVPYLDWLRAHPGSYVPGATGQLTSDQFGRIHRVLTWAVFQDGIARPLVGNLGLDAVTPTAAPVDLLPASPSSAGAAARIPAAASSSGGSAPAPAGSAPASAVRTPPPAARGVPARSGSSGLPVQR